MSEKPFNVRDRRHFTPEGRAREGSPAAAPAEEATAETRATALETQAAATEPGDKPGGRSAGPTELGPFLLSLGAQAAALLSDAAGDRPPGAEALDGAQAIISILEMLQDKTQGRRTGDEDRILEGLLFELRMAYVERRRMATP